MAKGENLGGVQKRGSCEWCGFVRVHWTGPRVHTVQSGGGERPERQAVLSISATSSGRPLIKPAREPLVARGQCPRREKGGFDSPSHSCHYLQGPIIFIVLFIRPFSQSRFLEIRNFMANFFDRFCFGSIVALKSFPSAEQSAELIATLIPGRQTYNILIDSDISFIESFPGS